MEIKWFKTKEEMFADKGECDYVYLPDNSTVEYHVNGGVTEELIDPELPSNSKDGCEYFSVIGMWIPESESESGVFVALDEYEKRQNELYPDDDTEVGK